MANPTLKEQTDQRIREHIETRYADDKVVRKLSQHYRREGYVKLRGLVPDDLFQEISQEVHRLLDEHGQRIDIHLKETGNTPRYMTTISQQAIAKGSELIPAVYESQAMMGFLSRLAAQPVLECPWEEEKYIAIRQHRKGDTHGWHWGDFSFTVIWIIEAPDAKYGGQLQCIPHTDWDKNDPQVEDYLLEHPIKTYGHVTGDLYFLRSDTTLHRTIPLNADQTRIILNTCWGSESDMKKEATHETMNAMFD
ncbi:hypothetical protein [Streptosporangium longisporum]|uniref:ArpA protein n=1 Tax=Streptosporangium longisporum TaxID=46187 RepID=A0ABP6KN00_9ACTN